MAWFEIWTSVFGREPAVPASMEESVEDSLARLITGDEPVWFEPRTPTAAGERFLLDLTAVAFGPFEGRTVTRFHCEFALPVPPAWRPEIPFTYRSPDLAWWLEDRLVIVELKTRVGSHKASQIADYLRLARHAFPDNGIDVALLAPRRFGARPAIDDRQRYAELTWTQVPAALRSAYRGDAEAGALASFLETVFDGAETSVQASAVAVTDWSALMDLANAAAHAAHRAGPALAYDESAGTERGIDVAFPTVEAAAAAKADVTAALQSAGLGDKVGVWLWQRSTSGGTPTTPAGHDRGFELRLHPKRSR